MSELGHNSNDPAVGGIAADRLRSIVERVERLEEERKGLAGD
ncbi:GapR family DNA-binding domain-containing protein, partial [Acetobacter lovaniensis]